MGHITTTEPPSKPFNIVAVIEGIIHDHHRLDAFRHQARLSLRETGLLPHNRIWDYLHWRRSLDPPRFDYYHPEFVHLFRVEQRNIDAMRHHRPTPGTLAGLSLVPEPSTGALAVLSLVPERSTPEAYVPVVNPPQNPPPVIGATVPEPGSMTLALAALASGAALVTARWVRRIRRTGQPGGSQTGPSMD
jgi:hypothetical protein